MHLVVNIDLSERNMHLQIRSSQYTCTFAVPNNPLYTLLQEGCHRRKEH